jgi:hypothetical protein
LGLVSVLLAGLTVGTGACVELFGVPVQLPAMRDAVKQKLTYQFVLILCSVLLSSAMKPNCMRSPTFKGQLWFVTVRFFCVSLRSQAGLQGRVFEYSCAASWLRIDVSRADPP